MPATTTFQNYAQNEQQSQNLGALDPTQVRMPQDSDAEKSILSAMLLSDDVLQECLMRLRVDDFYLQSHKMIFNAICALAEQGHQADPISVADYLKPKINLIK